MSSYFQSKSFHNIVFLLLIFFSNNLFAQDTEINGSNKTGQETQNNETLEEQLLKSNRAISNWFDSITEGIDLFLVGKQLQSENNKTSIKIENSTYTSEGKESSNQTVLAINPRFPNLEKYWNLKFTTYDEQEDSRRADTNLLRQAPRETNYGATIGLFRRFGSVRTAFQPRIELQNPLKVSHTLSFETVADFQAFKVNPKLSFFANATTGTGIFQAVNFNLELSNIYSLTLVNEGTYEDKINKFSANNGVSLGQAISNTNAMAYSLFFFSTNRENYHLETYTFSTTWYHLIYKKILDFQLTPHLDYAQIQGFKGQAGVTFKITLSF